VDFAARKLPGELPRIETCEVLSEFGKLHASGDGQHVKVDGSLDLALLARRVGQIVNLGDMQPAGTATGSVVLNRERSGVFGITGDVRLQNLVVALGSDTVREDDVQLHLEANGHVKEEAYRLEAAAAELTSGQEKIGLTLIEPIADVRSPHAA